MVFAYYNRLTKRQQRTYQQSDRVPAIALPEASFIRPEIEKLALALVSEDRLKVQSLCQELVEGLVKRLKVSPVWITVLAVRPSRSWGELHGLYTPAGDRGPAKITLWMRTAQRGRVVAFKTFVRTLSHELCHHLDYEFLGLEESFHTEGFYKRESSLLHQLMGDTQERVEKHGPA